MSELTETYVPDEPRESDLQSARQHLHLSLERVLGAASIAELDADRMRSAVIEALETFEEAERLAHGKSRRVKADLYVEAAKSMAATLGMLRRVHVSTVVLGDSEEWDLYGI